MLCLARIGAQSPARAAPTGPETATWAGSPGAVSPGISGFGLITTGIEKNDEAGEATTLLVLFTNEIARYWCQGRNRARPGCGSASRSRSAWYQPAGYWDGRTWPCIPNKRPLP